MTAVWKQRSDDDRKKSTQQHENAYEIICANRNDSADNVPTKTDIPYDMVHYALTSFSFKSNVLLSSYLPSFIEDTFLFIRTTSNRTKFWKVFQQINFLGESEFFLEWEIKSIQYVSKELKEHPISDLENFQFIQVNSSFELWKNEQI